MNTYFKNKVTNINAKHIFKILNNSVSEIRIRYCVSIYFLWFSALFIFLFYNLTNINRKFFSTIYCFMRLLIKIQIRIFLYLNILTNVTAEKKMLNKYILYVP